MQLWVWKPLGYLNHISFYFLRLIGPRPPQHLFILAISRLQGNNVWILYLPRTRNVCRVFNPRKFMKLMKLRGGIPLTFYEIESGCKIL